MIRIVTVASLYPNPVMPGRGIFVENRLRNLVASGEVEAAVIAPVPWFPFTSDMFGEYGQWARVTGDDIRYGIPISHPRHLVIPKIGMNLAPRLMVGGIIRALKKLQATGYDFDLIDAHFFYPDGVAAVMAGAALGKPVVITARGSDLNVNADFDRPRNMIKWAAAKAAGLVTVSDALKRKLESLGVDPVRIKVLRNGVDLQLFKLQDREAARARLGLDGRILLSVGNLVASKGHDIAIRSLRLLPDVKLLIAGAGPEEAALKALAQSESVADRVTFLGRVQNSQLPSYYGAADILVLASAREGMANVLLEALASGTPVVASDIPGMDEVIDPPESGRLMAARTPEALAQAVNEMFVNPPDRKTTRAYAEKFNWDDTTRGQIDLFTEILAARG